CMSITILLAEDDPLLRSFLGEVLSREHDLEIVGGAGDGFEAVEAAARLLPDVLLLDLNLPRLRGLKVLERLAEAGDPASVLILSGDEAWETQLEAARAGAKGFVAKTQAPRVLADAIRAVMRGEVWFTRQIMGR